MMKRQSLWLMAVCLGLTAATAWGEASPAGALPRPWQRAGVPRGTSVVSVTVDGASAVVDLSAEAAVGLTDTQSDEMVKGDRRCSRCLAGDHGHRGYRGREAALAVPASGNRR